MPRPAAGGSYFAEDEAAPSWSARDLWLDAVDPSVLTIEALPAMPGRDAIDFNRLGVELIALSNADGGEHLLVRDGNGRLRIDVVAGTALAGPIVPRVTLDGLEALGPKTLALRRLRGLSKSGRLPASLFEREPRAARWSTMLQVFDGLEAGASQRDIAVALFGHERVASDWRGASDHLRTAVRRLIAGTRRMVDHGYRSLLQPSDRL
jgi:hypothetical protein